MTRVTENGQTATLNFNLNKTKSRLERMQLKGSTLKAMSRPSDNPVGNVQAMLIGTNIDDNNQYIKNANYATLLYDLTEKSIEQLTNILMKAKEIAITQSSNFYNPDVRKNVMHEVIQLRKQALSLGNKRMGQKYIFGGFSTKNPPFNLEGEYQGDTGHISVEVAKDFFLPINLHGAEVFYGGKDSDVAKDHPLNHFEDIKTSPKGKIEKKLDEGEKLNGRFLASEVKDKSGSDGSRKNLFALLESLKIGLENDDTKLIQSLLEELDDGVTHLVTLRSRLGSLQNSITTSVEILESETLSGQTQKSKIVDADIAELFSDIMRQQDVLKTSYQAGQSLINQTLLDFLR